MVSAALRPHVSSERQRLAASAGAQIDDSLAGLGLTEAGDELAALVLHLDQAILPQRRLFDCSPFGKSNSIGGQGCWLTFGQRRKDCRPVGFQPIDAQVQRRAGQQFRLLRVIERRGEQGPQP